MADIRIKDLTTTASSTASDDFIAVDGTTNGTRKLNAFSPTFGGNATVTGTLAVNGTSATVGSGTGSITCTLNGAAGSYKLSIYKSGGIDRWYAGVAADAESGSDSGAPYVITALTDAGAIIDHPLSIARVAGGSITSTRPISITSTTASTSTSSGALVVGNGTSGGLGVGGDVSVAGRIRAQLSIASDGSVPSGLASAYQVDTASATVRDILSFGNGSRAGLIRGYQDGGGVIDFRFGRYTASTFEEQMRLSGTTAASSSLTLYGTTASTSTSSGALVVSGGVGVAGAAFLGGNVTSAGTRGFVRYKSSNGSTASPVEDRIVGFSNTNDLLFEGGMYGVNSLTDNSAVWLRFKTLNTSGTAVTALTLDAAQKAEFASTIKTAAPSGGTAAEWKLGTVATVSPTSPNRTIEVDIGGTIYYIAAKTTNN
jgi:hypothetical protein